MMKILTVIGARPQFIKAAVLSRVIANTDGIEEILVHTGQHYDYNMSEIFFSELKIPQPQYNLSIGGGNHGYMTGHQLIKIEEVILDNKPDYVLVYGDTNSTLAGALAASKLHFPVVHVEAGLRSFNKKMPEEINRILTDHVSNILFTPSDQASNNLRLEGIRDNFIHNVGDIMYDAVKFYSNIADNNLLEKYKLNDKGYHLVTIHRQENTDNSEMLKKIFEGFSMTNEKILIPLHPRTRNRLSDFGVNLSENIIVISPVSYLEMMVLQKHAKKIITDSGGVQKEAFFHGKPCLTLRTETEWTELIDLGVNQLVPIESEVICQKILEPVEMNINDCKIYGDGTTADKIVKILVG